MYGSECVKYDLVRFLSLDTTSAEGFNVSVV